MSYDIDEQENLENLKAWWEQYGKIVTNIITAILIGISAYFGYKWYQAKQEQNAYNIVNKINSAIDTNKNNEALKFANDLIKEYPNSTHTVVGTIRVAENVAKTDINKSIDLLKLVKNDSPYNSLLQYRLSGFLIDGKRYDEAIKVLEKPENQVWEGLYSDRIGDAYIAKGDTNNAKLAYEKALKLAKSNNNSALESFVELKMSVNNSL